jgi:hypothetical protein
MTCIRPAAPDLRLRALGFSPTFSSHETDDPIDIIEIEVDGHQRAPHVGIGFHPLVQARRVARIALGQCRSELIQFAQDRRTHSALLHANRPRRETLPGLETVGGRCARSRAGHNDNPGNEKGYENRRQPPEGNRRGEAFLMRGVNMSLLTEGEKRESPG